MAEDVRIAARVQRGARWLDENRPGWVGDIDLITLDVHDPEHCVVGQLYGGWDESPFYPAEPADPKAVDLGFFALAEIEARGSGAMQAEYRLLTEAWGDLIERRIAERIAAEVTGDA
ncbi:hypothetical protein O7626_39485 [Micromonospora sp. WMMD1102]|uniref:hypothetical protein n=1 Tax=Micromonospora sp. WMMD1102 TaxID=3016105 RepID=UPI002414E462|nr:hypothetical protein [Micromonospora sp. WMMD1102]MDG4784395.1 hypothetical protein [Micromonospora sp. WMMD1102]MDG4791899.1 hypothetical protein [Micromonospora sp. WMMD1102]